MFLMYAELIFFFYTADGAMINVEINCGSTVNQHNYL